MQQRSAGTCTADDDPLVKIIQIVEDEDDDD